MAINSLQSDWFAENQRYLMAEVSQIRQLLQEKLAQASGETSNQATVQTVSQRIGQTRKTFLSQPGHSAETPPVLESLCQRFGLSQFERQILLLCAGVELSRAFGALCAALHGDSKQTYPTFGLAFSLFPEGEWAAITPDSPLRRWRMIEVMPGVELTHSPLRIDEYILHWLMGVESLDVRLRGLVKPIPNTAIGPLADSHQQIVKRISVTGLLFGAKAPVIQLWGGELETKRAIALAAAAQSGWSLHTINADALPTDRSQLELLQSLWERESIFRQSLLLMEYEQDSPLGDREAAQQQSLVSSVIEQSCRPLMVASGDRLAQRQRPLLSIEVHSPTPDEQQQLWYTHLGETAKELNGQALNGQVNQLVSYFNLSASGIHSVCQQVNNSHDAEDMPAQLWRTCLAQARPKLGELAQRIPSSADWDDLILPDAEFNVLKTIAAHVRQRSTVYEQWGFASRGRRGLGISALFAGGSGTGKTLAAETLANKLNLDLYRIDLSMVVSKYIGETEKNLRRIFDGAEKGGAILLFDEADALFGKRSDVKDARDRYANMEVAYLLQRIEAYRGLAILTTNLKDSLDQAFLRRIRFVVQFPFPNATQREKIWRCSFPAQVPLGDLKFKMLAKLNLAGGNIRNIVLNAAFLAADEGGMAVEMCHLLKAAQSEYIKLERPLTELSDRDIQKWIGSEQS
ncbi:MAG: ATP-binding protein [Cyanobacteria bacterium J06560_6]